MNVCERVHKEIVVANMIITNDFVLSSWARRNEKCKTLEKAIVKTYVRGTYRSNIRVEERPLDENELSVEGAGIRPSSV